jgi:adenylate kinase
MRASGREITKSRQGGSVIFCRKANRAGSHSWRLPFLVSILALPSYAYLTGPVVVLIGPPGSGKTTQTEILRKTRGMAVISADDLIARNKREFARFKNPHIEGVEPRLDPVLNRLVEEAIASADLSKGVILDGYPAAKNQGDHLAALQRKFSLSKVLVIHLRVPDNVVRQRLKDQKRADLDQELKDYHREFDFAREYFTDIHEIDGTKKPEIVAEEIRKLLQP